MRFYSPAGDFIGEWKEQKNNKDKGWRDPMEMVTIRDLCVLEPRDFFKYL